MNMEQPKGKLKRWNLLVGTIGVCLVPLLFQVVLLVSVFTMYESFDRFVLLQRTLRNTELLMANMTTSEERAVISFTRYRLTKQTGDLESIHKYLAEMDQGRKAISDEAGRYPRLLERIKPFLASAEKYATALGRTAEVAHKLDLAASTDELLPEHEFTSLLRDGLNLRKDLSDSHTFDIAGSDPLERFQLVLLCIFGVVSVLNFVVAGGAAFYLVRFLRKRLEVSQANCEAILAGTAMMTEPTGNVEFAELDASLAEAAAALALMKRKRLAVSEGASEVIFAMDQSLRVQMISEACQPRWGYSPDFLTQRNIIDIVHPSDATIAATMVERAKSTGSADGNLRIRHRSGMFVESRWSMKWNQAKSQAVVVSLDQTQDQLQRNMLIQQTEHQAQLIESLPIALLTANADGTISGASRQLYELFPGAGDVLGRRVEELLAGAAPRPGWNDLRQSEQQPLEVLMSGDRQEPLSLEVRAHQIEMSDKQSYLISFEDISEKYEVERFRQELVSMVSHDLRTPLTSVSAVLEMLGVGAYGTVSEEGLRAAAKAGWAASGLIQLINDLLDIERAKARRINLDAETANTNDLLTQVFSELEDLCYERGIELPSLNQPVTGVTVDGARAKQALKAVMEVLIQCALPQSPIRLLTRDADGHYFDIFVGAGSCRITEPEFQQLGNVYDNRAAFERLGSPFIRLHIACAEALMGLMGGSLRVMNVQGALGFVIRFQKARALANV